MEKVLTILGVIVLLMIFYLLFSKRAKRFILKFLNYKLLIIKGTTNFINKYREDICVYIKHNFEKEDYTKKKEDFDKRFDKCCVSARRYYRKPLIFRLVECFIKKTTDEETLFQMEKFPKEFTSLIQDIEKELP